MPKQIQGFGPNGESQYFDGDSIPKDYVEKGWTLDDPSLETSEDDIDDDGAPTADDDIDGHAAPTSEDDIDDDGAPTSEDDIE